MGKLTLSSDIGISITMLKDERFVLDELRKVTCVPWNTKPEGELEVPEFKVRDPDGAEGEIDADHIPRKMIITTDMLNEFGSTPRCPGCAAVRL